MERHVTSLPIPNNLKAKLVKGGIQSVNEMKSIKPVDLCKGIFNLRKLILGILIAQKMTFT